MSEGEFRVVGTGLTVYEDATPIEGPVVWLDSPEAVLDFVDTDDVTESIVVSRGGTTTFLTPALVAGVKGVITLQGAPTSHLGIISREYGIPCLMSVTFEEGIRTPRGEVIPPDGAIVRLDVSTSPSGNVLVAPGTSLGAAASEGVSDEDAEQAAEEAAKLQHMLDFYRGEAPHFQPGNDYIRARQKTPILELERASLQRDLTLDEVNDLIAFAGWSNWDALAARATEGESGLIPRQEYEGLGILQMWHGLPKWWRLIHDEVGIDGLYEMGSIARKEIGTKINLLHIYVTGVGPASGRGLAIELGHHSASDRADDIAFAMQFSRRLYRGMWNDEGPMYPSNRNFSAPILEEEWLSRFRDERASASDPDQRRLFQKFNGSTGLLSFLLHFDNRLGVGDSGPYRLPGGGWMIVRDHVINEPAYHWSDSCEGLPYVVTQAMFFDDEPPVETWMMDLGTLYTKPSNYLRNLSGYAVYVRDRFNTPVSQIRRINDAEMSDLLSRVDQAASRLYTRIAGMSYREKIMAGVRVYYADWVAPLARAAGIWEKFVNDYDFYTIDPLTEAAYEPLVQNGDAAWMVPPLFITGSGFQPVEARTGE